MRLYTAPRFLVTAILLLALFHFVRSDELQTFIGDDKELAVLNLDMDDVFNYFEPEMLMQQVNPEDFAEYDHMSPDEINSELRRLCDALERVYNTLLAFARVLASMTADDFVEFSEKLVNDPKLYDTLLKEHTINTNVDLMLASQKAEGGSENDELDTGDRAADALVAYLNGDVMVKQRPLELDATEQRENDNLNSETKTKEVLETAPGTDESLNELHLDDDEDDLDSLINNFEDHDSQDYGDLQIYNENGELNSTVEYWDPTDEYKMLLEMFGKDPKDMEVLEKMGIVTLIKKVLKKIRKILKKIKKKIVIILKLIKLKVYVKKIRVVICLKIMILIEKIKRLIKLIIQLIKKIIKFVIKELPFEILWQIRVVIKLILRILSDILWEAEILILEILVKTVKLLRLLKKIPTEIVYYFKMSLLEKLQMFKKDVPVVTQEVRMKYYNKVWADYDSKSDEGDEEEDTLVSDGEDDLKVSGFGSGNIWDYDGTPDIEYSESDYIHIPGELQEIFGSVFSEEEMDDILRGDDSFNFDFVWPSSVEKRSTGNGDKERGKEDAPSKPVAADQITGFRLNEPKHNDDVISEHEDHSMRVLSDDTMANYGAVEIDNLPLKEIKTESYLLGFAGDVSENAGAIMSHDHAFIVCSLIIVLGYAAMTSFR